MKRWYESKTMWANLSGGTVTLAGVFGLELGMTPEAQAQFVAGIMVVVNIILRLATKKGIK